MIKKNLLISLRILFKDRLSSLISVLGLSVGLASAMIVFVYVYHQHSYDTYHDEAETIYRMTSQLGAMGTPSTPVPLGKAMADEFADVENSVRILSERVIIRKEDQLLKERVILTDPEYFKVFHFDFIYGDSDQALNEVHNIILTEETARQFFGNSNPMNKTISLRLNGEFKDYTVSGVVNIPSNTSLYFDFIIPFKNALTEGLIKDENYWGSFGISTFIKLQKGAGLKNIQAGMPDFMNKYLGDMIRSSGKDPKDYFFDFKPIIENRLSEDSSSSGFKGGIGKDQNRMGIILAAIILVIAAFNFMNLSIARSSSRFKEVAVRKINGAGRMVMIRQFLLESIVISFISLIIASGMAELGLLYFSGYMETQLSISIFTQPLLLTGLISFTILTGIMSGIYPAFIVSRIDAVKLFSKQLKFGGSNWFTKLLITIQFIASSVLIIGSLFIEKQNQYLMSKSLGYNEENILVIPMAGSSEDRSRMAQFFKEKLDQNPNVISAAASQYTFTRGGSIASIVMDGQEDYVFNMKIDDKFLPTMGIEIKEGRNFTQGTGDETTSVIVNETFVKQYGIEDPVGFNLNQELFGIENPVIVGVMKDFNFQDLKKKIFPMMFHSSPKGSFGNVILRVREGRPGEVINEAKQLWARYYPDTPFDFYFLKDELNEQYKSEEQLASLMGTVTLIAIFIALFGLYGLISLMVIRRQKEVGIRKVLGASIVNLLGLLSRDFIILLLIALVISIPVSYYLVDGWLNEFAYRIPMEPVIFITAALLMMLITWITVGTKSIKTVLINPADSLRDE